METVVVPIDHTPSPQLALRTAFSLANRCDLSVLLVTACPADQAEEAERSLREAGERFAAIAPHSVEVLPEPAVDAVLASASDSDGMICLSTHGRVGVSRLVFGSVAEELIRHSTVPILCVGPDVSEIALPDEIIEGLVCTDDSDATNAVLAGATAFAEMVDASCVVTQVVGPDEDVTTDGRPPPQPIRDRAEQHCAEIAERLTAAGIAATCHVLPGHPASSIVQHASHRGSAFIVVGTSGKTGLARLALGSVATEVVRHARCPVLVVPTLPDTEQDDAEEPSR